VGNGPRFDPVSKSFPHTATAMRVILAAVLLASAVAKLVGNTRGWAVPSPVLVCAALAEVYICVLLLLHRHVTRASWATMLLAAGGSAVSLVATRPCGCLGGLLTSTPRAHGILAGSIGLLAFLVLCLHSKPKGR